MGKSGRAAFSPEMHATKFGVVGCSRKTIVDQYVALNSLSLQEPAVCVLNVRAAF